MRTNEFLKDDKVSWFDELNRKTVTGHIVKIIPGNGGADRAVVTHKRIKEFNHYFDITIGCYALTMIENAPAVTQ